MMGAGEMACPGSVFIFPRPILPILDGFIHPLPQSWYPNTSKSLPFFPSSPFISRCPKPSGFVSHVSPFPVSL